MEQLDEQNIQNALEMAGKLFKVISDPEFVKETDAEARHKIVAEKYPHFTRAYPRIAAIMTRDLRYNETAFRKYLYKLKKDPGRGMDGFIACQADYVKFLYIEECRMNGKHWSIVRANEIWRAEYTQMNKFVKRIQEEEKKAKNEFAEEQQKNLEIKRRELLEFINFEEPPVPEKVVSVESMEPADIVMLIRSQLDNRKSILDDIQEFLTRLTYYMPDISPEARMRDIMIGCIDPELTLDDTPKLVKLVSDLNDEAKSLEAILNETIKLYEGHAKHKSAEVKPDDWLSGIIDARPRNKTKRRTRKH